MKLPINVAKQYTEINLNPEEIEDQLARKVGEVESLEDISKAYEGTYVAKIVKKEDHPEADKLGIYQITLGEEEIQVVAGDKTLEVDDKIAYIKPGNIVPSTYKTTEEFKIKAMKMRGILSNGMMCSEKEVNIGPDHSKVMRLDKDAKVGQPFSEYYQLNDTVVEIENKALTNRGDLFGIIGLARELAASQNTPFETPDWLKIDTLNPEIKGEKLELEITNNIENLCPRYIGIVMDNIQIAPSPIWLKSVLIKSGIKPINNVVDITNYLMVLTGQPLHAFDYDKVVKNDPNNDTKAHITIRLAQDKERVKTLDNKVTELNSNTLVIADSTNPIAVAGMIGGMDTEIDNSTNRIIIECANFDRFNIRKSSMALGIRTDAVTRFTRAQDPNQCLPVIGKAIELVEMLADGRVSSNLIDSYPQPLEKSEITLSVEKINNHLGTELGRQDIIKILENIEYEILPQEGLTDYITVVPPTFRRDILIPEDIHEDIGRIYGYDNIAPRIPKRDMKAAKKNKNIDIKSRIRTILKNSGANEIITYNFIGIDLVEKANQDPNLCYKIKNALSPELELMRPSLLPSILEKTQQNASRNINEFALFEFNISHQKGYMDKFELPAENWHMSFIYTDKTNQFDGNPYYITKRYFEKVINTLGIEIFKYELVADTNDSDLPIWIKNIIPTFNRNSSAIIYRQNGEKKEILGVMGDLDKEVKENFKLPEYTSALEIDLELLKKIKTGIKQYKENSKYPPLTQDICFTVNKDLQYKEIEERVIKALENRKTTVYTECIDIYQEDKDSETKNITVRVTVEHMEKTLKDKDIEKAKKNIEHSLSKL